MPTPTQLAPAARIWLYGDGAGQPGEDGFVVVAGSPVAAIAGTDANQITTAAIVANAYQGFTLEVVDGPAAGYRRTILTNTTSSIIPCRRFETEDTVTAVTPVAGNTIRILRPSVIFSGYDTAGNTDGIPGLFSGIGNGDGGAPLLLVNLAFDSVVNQTEINRCTIFGAGIEFRGTVAPIFTNCNGSFGNWDNVFATAANQASLPQGTNLSLAKTNWFTDIGLALAPSPLATWRGWGLSQPDVTAVAVATTGPRFLSCQMSMFATVGDLHGSSSVLTLGGRFWGDVTMERGFYQLIGRADFGVGSFIKASVFARKIRTELCTVLAAANAGAFGFTYTAAADHQWTSISSDVQMLNSGVFVSSPSAFLKMEGGGTFELGAGSAWDFTTELNEATGLGLIQVAAGTFTQAADFLATNNLAGFVVSAPSILAEQSGSIEIIGGPFSIVGNPGALTGNRGILARNGGRIHNTVAVNTSIADLHLDGGEFHMGADLNPSIVGGAGTTALISENRSIFTQTAGNLTCGGRTEILATSWFSSAGDGTFLSNGPAVQIRDGSTFEIAATAGAWSITSTNDVPLDAENSDITVLCDAFTLDALTGATTTALLATNSRIRLAPATTLAFTQGGIELYQSSELIVNADLASNGSLTVDFSKLTTTGLFSTELETQIFSSECNHGGASYNTTAAAQIELSSIRASGPMVFGAGLTTLTQTSLQVAGSTTFGGSLEFINSALNFANNCDVLNQADGENSTVEIQNGNLAVVNKLTVLRCDLHVKGDFSADEVALTDSDMSVTGTYTDLGATTLESASKLITGGTLVAANLTLTGNSELLSQGSLLSAAVSLTDSTLVAQSNTVLTGALTLTGSCANFTGRLVGINIVATCSELFTADFGFTENTRILNTSTWTAVGGGATSTINSSSTNNSGLSVANGSVVDFSLIGFSCRASGHVAPAQPGVSVTGGSKLIFDSANLVTQGVDSDPGIFYRASNLICINGAPVNIDGNTNRDFQDEQGFFLNTESIAGRTIFSGQHAGGTYSALAIPTGFSTLTASV
jgi:hypothetical protein